MHLQRRSDVDELTLELHQLDVRVAENGQGSVVSVEGAVDHSLAANLYQEVRACQTWRVRGQVARAAR